MIIILHITIVDHFYTTVFALFIFDFGSEVIIYIVTYQNQAGNCASITLLYIHAILRLSTPPPGFSATPPELSNELLLFSCVCYNVIKRDLIKVKLCCSSKKLC